MDGLIYTGRLINTKEALRTTGSKTQSKWFNAGHTIRFRKVNRSRIPNQYMIIYQCVDTGYMFDAFNVATTGVIKPEQPEAAKESIQEAEVVGSKTKGKRKLKSRTLNVDEKTASLLQKRSDSNYASNIQRKSKLVVNGAMIGAVVGLGFALWKKQNKFILVSIGATTGAFFGNKYFEVVKPSDKIAYKS